MASLTKGKPKMIDQKRKAFRDADFNSNTKPEDIKYYVGEKFDQAGLPAP